MKIHDFEKIRRQEAICCRTWANLGAQKEPKWSPRGSQNGAKKEKKNEVKLREVKGAKKRIRVKEWQVVTRPLGE